LCFIPVPLTTAVFLAAEEGDGPPMTGGAALRLWAGLTGNAANGLGDASKAGRLGCLVRVFVVGASLATPEGWFEPG
jgi:hypothetical protein